eukprot:scaffold3012_cov106-Isochrysis_galbana.AAC.2
MRQRGEVTRWGGTHTLAQPAHNSRDSWRTRAKVVEGKDLLLWACRPSNRRTSSLPAPPHQVRFRKTLHSVKRYMSHQRLSPELQSRADKYFEYLWAKTRGVEIGEVIEDLNASLRTDVMSHICRDAVNSVPLFRDRGTEFISSIVQVKSGRRGTGRRGGSGEKWLHGVLWERGRNCDLVWSDEARPGGGGGLGRGAGGGLVRGGSGGVAARASRDVSPAGEHPCLACQLPTAPRPAASPPPRLLGLPANLPPPHRTRAASPAHARRRCSPFSPSPKASG